MKSAPTAAIGYLRVSTSEQGRSGLSLEAQKHAVEAFAEKEALPVKAWYQDIQTGAGADAVLLRPGLASALKDARKLRCPLIVSRLDRLSRNVHFISGLMEHKVHFMVAALGKDCDNFTLHIYASLAEQERKLISDRIKVAIAAARARGHEWGMRGRSKAWFRKFRQAGQVAKRKAVKERAEHFRAHIEWALRQPSFRGGVISFHEAAQKLNQRGIGSQRGKSWDGWAVQRTAAQLGIEHPIGVMRVEKLQAGVRSLLQKNPSYTVEEIRKDPHWPRPLDRARVYPIVRTIRREAVRRNATYSKIGWPIDRWTTARLQVAGILRRNPSFVAWQVLAQLLPHYRVSLSWVQRVTHEYRAGSYKESKIRNQYWNTKNNPRRKTSAPVRKQRAPFRSSRKRA